MPQDSPRRIVYGEAMNNDNSAIREQLSDQWQKVAIDLIRGGIPAETVFESMLTVGLAGHVEVHGKDFTATKLVAIAEQLSEQVRRVKEALQEASNATKN
jgi:ribosomal protein S15P/S13E